MREVIHKIKPTSGVSHLFHLALVLILPIGVFVLIWQHFDTLAFALIILSKWRMFAVRPRFWPANIRANSIDLMVGLSIAVFMTQTNSILTQLAWVIVYAIWLLAIKPGKTITMVTFQAFLGQLASLSALYLWSDSPVWVLTLLTGLFCFLAARHFLDIFDEPYARMLAYIWGYFGAALAWLLSHWLLYHQGVAEPTLLLGAIGYGVAVLYYLDHNDRLSKGIQRQVLFIMIAIVAVVFAVLVKSSWGGKVV